MIQKLVSDFLAVARVTRVQIFYSVHCFKKKFGVRSKFLEFGRFLHILIFGSFIPFYLGISKHEIVQYTLGKLLKKKSGILNILLQEFGQRKNAKKDRTSKIDRTPNFEWTPNLFWNSVFSPNFWHDKLFFHLKKGSNSYLCLNKIEIFLRNIKVFDIFDSQNFLLKSYKPFQWRQ